MFYVVFLWAPIIPKIQKKVRNTFFIYHYVFWRFAEVLRKKNLLLLKENFFECIFTDETWKIFWKIFSFSNVWTFTCTGVDPENWKKVRGTGMVDRFSVIFVRYSIDMYWKKYNLFRRKGGMLTASVLYRSAPTQ